jgi:hypothetical protein
MTYRYINFKASQDPEFNPAARPKKTKKITVQPSRRGPKAAFVNESKMISPPPAYGDAIKTIFNTQGGITEQKAGHIESYRTFNGRTYAIVKDESGTQLVPTRAPSAALFNYQMAYNSYN